MANEKRLIDADVLVEAIVNTPSEVAKFHTYNVLSSLAERQHEILDLIENQSTVDAVEVVRCNECKYGMKSCLRPRHAKNHLCRHSWEGEYHEPDHFCSYGERRSDA